MVSDSDNSDSEYVEGEADKSAALLCISRIHSSYYPWWTRRQSDDGVIDDLSQLSDPGPRSAIWCQPRGPRHQKIRHCSSQLIVAVELRADAAGP